MAIQTQKVELINNLKNSSDKELADIALYIWIEQQERKQLDHELSLEAAETISMRQF